MHRLVLRQDEGIYPGGHPGFHAVLQNPDTVLVAAVDDNEDIYLVRQWRHAWGEVTWEVPAGTLDEGEDPETAARRELEEETGLTATSLVSLGTLRGSAFMTGTAHLFLAQRLVQGERKPEIYEMDMQVLKRPLAQALDMAADGTIVHGASIATLLRVRLYLENVKE